MPRPAKSKTIKHLGCSIIKERGCFRAYIPRTRGAGRIRKAFRDVPAAKAWIEANLTAARTANTSAPLTPAQTAEYHAATALLPPGLTLTDAARHAATHHAKTTTRANSPLISTATAEFLTAKKAANCRPRTLQEYKGILAILPQNASVSSITTDDLEKTLGAFQPRRRNGILTTWRTFFKWCLRPRRAYTPKDPTENIEKTKEDWKAPAIYTPPQMTQILAYAEKHEPRIIPHLAVMAFAGVRVSGVWRLEADAINLENDLIFVSGAADKMRRSYTVEITPNLKKWLLRYPFQKMDISEIHHGDLIARTIKKSGVTRAPNGFRHSFASYLFAQKNDANFVASQLGQFGGIDMLLGHYRHITTPKKAAEYFSICPQSAQRP